MPTLNEIYTIFQVYGEIDRILMKKLKNHTMWSFIQFSNKKSAEQAVSETNLRSM